MKKAFFCLLFLIGMFSLNANEFLYRHITNNDGLSNSSVNTIFQDSYGYIWFGTWDGLNKYDGINFTIYNSNPGDSNSITNNVIKNIIEQRPGIIWVATDHGINRLNTQNGIIDRYYLGYENISPSLENAYSITCSKSGRVFCSTYEWGLAFYDENQNDFIPVVIPKFSTFDIKQIYAVGDSQLWILKRSGDLYKIDYHIDACSLVVKNKIEITNTDCSDFYSIGKAGKEHLFLTTYDNRLFKINTSNSGLKEMPLRYKKNTPRGQLLNAVSTPKGELYIPYSFDGVDIYIEKGDSLIFKKNICHKIALFDIYYTSQDILWIGSDGQGVIKIYSDSKEFHNTTDYNIGIEINGAVRCFYLDNENLYTGIKGGGIICTSNFFDQEKRHSSRLNIGDNFVYHIQKGFGNDLFVGTDAKGLYIYNTQTGITSLITSNNANEQFSSIYSILADKQSGEIWLGTSGYGLVRLQVNYMNGKYELISVKKYMRDKSDDFSISNNIVYSIVKDNDNLWLATRGGGLCRFNIAEERFYMWKNDPTDKSSISSNDLLSLSIDQSHNLWIGTSYGLNVLELDNIAKGFKHYTTEDGFSNNTIHGVVPLKGKLWLSTNKGLVLFDPVKKDIFNFYSKDGLQSDEFSDGAYYRNENCDYIFMGGINGFNYFKPDDILMRNFVPPIDIAYFNIFDKKENIRDFISEKNGEDILNLQWSQRFFSFNFISMDYIDSEKCEYKYILEGFSQKWTYNGTSPYISFTNVPPGKYTLKVMTSNGDKIWNTSPYILSVHIMAPWWRTTFAFLCYALLIILLGWIIYRIFKHRWFLQNEIQLQRIESQHMQVIHQSKLRFFTNIAHEFSSSLALIYGPCRKLLEYSENEYTKKYLNLIRINADRMQRLINDLMEFRKVETDHLSFNFEHINISEMINYLRDNFEELGEEKKIILTLDLKKNLMWVTDRDALEKILFNIISNAYKYTPCSGEIGIKVSTDETGLKISISNSGSGIPAERLNEIFNRFKVLDNIETQASQGKLRQTGVGMALTKSLVIALDGTIQVNSIENQSTTFTVILPQKEAASHSDKGMPPEELILTPVDKNVTSIQSGSRLTILVVEDETDMRSFIKDILSERFNIIEAANGKQGLDILKKMRPSIILTDVLMPVMEGITFVREVKSNPITNHIPVIILSSRVDMEDKVSGYNSGIDTYVSKPFSPQYLLSVVHQILNIRNNLKQYYTSGLSKIDLHEGITINENDKDFIVAITKLIETNIENENLSPTFICDNMALSRMQLYRKIKTLTGHSPSEFIRGIKLKSAANLLKTSNLTVQEIMFMTGFNSKSYFYREFTDMFGVSPKEYRNKYSKGESAIML